jgi:hypothetical protein
MLVRQLVGNLAGKVVDLPFSVARDALENGTAEHIHDDAELVPNVAALTVAAVAAVVVPRRPRGRPRLSLQPQS